MGKRTGNVRFQNCEKVKMLVADAQDGEIVNVFDLNTNG